MTMKRFLFLALPMLAPACALCMTNTVTVVTNQDGSVTFSSPYTCPEAPECREVFFTVKPGETNSADTAKILERMKRADSAKPRQSAAPRKIQLRRRPDAAKPMNEEAGK